MLTIFILFLSTHSTFAYDSTLDAWSQKRFNEVMTVCKDHSEYTRRLDTLRDDFRAKLSIISKDKLSEIMKRDPDDGLVTFASLAKEIWPQELPDSYKPKELFLDCAVKLAEFHSSFDKKALKKWKSCMNSSYEGELPKASQTLFDCFKKPLK